MKRKWGKKQGENEGKGEKGGGRDDMRKKKVKCASNKCEKETREVAQEEAEVQKVSLEAEPETERFVF